ncbi:L-lactate permease [Desulfosporosinus meridiei]|uniref:L-lactate permease n=1 Tax=Desulfosporosinus meridiei (strain ATCC BAA-275 / DSM 13257 / KCTC 12902 / NCIMB 13706 / S10) TaxID=768704 RepID=J7J164_DESMD|nr:lactate permease LctP family transporter [Desulfosporosinus meridiei]AFQ45053.1 L-lactate transport [Desulfosporosinus meridiei DSM 13257]
MPWSQNYAALNNSIGLTALVVSIPIFFLFWALAVKRMKGYIAGVLTLAITLVDVVLVYKMPVGTALSASFLGIVNGLFPIAWIVIAAVFLYNLTVESGHFDIIKSSIATISDDRRIQALLVAFSFGAFLEGAAGFGAPVAISGAILIGLGFEPLYAAGLCLIANTAPVAFGAIGSPIIAAGSVTGLGDFVISQAVGRQLPFLSVLIPLYLIILMAGWKAAKEVLPAILVTGVSFAVAQWWSANYLGAYLPDIISSLTSLLATTVFLKFWKPKTVWRFPSEKKAVVNTTHYSTGEVIKAWSPFVILTVMVAVWGTPSFKNWVTKDLQWFVNIPHWPGLDGLVYKVSPIVTKSTVYAASYKWDFFAAGGTAILITAIISMFILGVSPAKAVSVFGKTLKQLVYPIITMGSVLGFAYLANYSGLSFTLGLMFASTGKAFPFLSPVLGWVGVFLTGSDTSANALFGKLQQVTAEQIGVNPVLTVAANSSGGVVGKMISPQSIAVAAAATSLVGKESDLFRFTVKHSLIFLVIVSIMIGLQAYVVPEMIPTVASVLK